MNLSTDMLVTVAREFMRTMAQPYDRGAGELRTGAMQCLIGAAAAFHCCSL